MSPTLARKSAPFAIPIRVIASRIARDAADSRRPYEPRAVRRTLSLTTRFIEGEASPATKTAELSETTAPILAVVVTVAVATAMAYVLWRVFMKKYSKVRLGIRNLPVSR